MASETSSTLDAPTGGFAGVLSKARRSRDRRKTDASARSNVSSEVDLRSTATASSEGLRDRAKTEGSPVPSLPAHVDETESSGLSRLLGKSIGVKRRRRREKDVDDEAARGRNTTPIQRGAVELETASSNGDVEIHDGTGSSLLDLESEDDFTNATPPPLSSHPSHSGYLTTSSPLVKAAIISPDSPQLDGLAITSPSPSAPSLVSPALATTDSSPAVSKPSLQAPFTGSSKRSPSPVGRLREALSPKRIVSSPSTSPERKPANTGTRSRGNSLRLGTVFSDRNSVASVPELSSTTQSSTPNVTVRPSTPPQSEQAPAPVIVNTPPTPTDVQAPRFSSSRERGQSDPVTSSNPNIVTSHGGNMISHRRIRSGSATLVPSKLSHISNAPVTPTSDTPTSPGGTAQAGSFFSSMFSAAQNAANTLSNSIANSTITQNNQKNRQSVPPIVENDVEVEEGTGTMGSTAREEKELAVKTLGTGDLDLSQFGIMDTTNNDAQAGTKKRDSGVKDDESAVDDRAAKGAGASQAGDSSDEVSTAPELGPNKSRTFFDAPSAGDRTPPNGSVFEGKSGVQRSGSIRSAIGSASRRKRGSSAATSAIGAAIAAANASVAHPASQTGAPKLTGFAIASKKRNRDFHQLFRSVPEDDYLIEDYSCALQREILAHGRLYVSEGHLCFSSNIFGWVTTLVMSFDEIVSVEKRSTALVFKNGLVISTLHAKNVFASFTSRDSTYDLIIGIWKLSHPSLRSSLNGVMLGEAGGGDKTEKFEPPASISGGSVSDSESDDEEVYDEDEDEEEGAEPLPQYEAAADEAPEKTVSRVPSGAMLNGSEERGQDAGSSGGQDFPGPATHAPTTCADTDAHFERLIYDDVIAAPMGKVYDLIFGPTSATWMPKWLTVEQKCTEFQMEDKKGLANDNKSRSYSYIKPLYGAIGPKQTKCLTTETLDAFNLEKAVTVIVATQTPDVPSGNVFAVKTRYCLTWAEGGGTRMLVNCTIEWSGKSWIKGPIEKGAQDGQNQYAKDLAAAIRAAVSKSKAATGGAKGKKKNGRKERTGKAEAKVETPAPAKAAEKKDWGLFEPLHGPLGPVVDILKPLLSGNILYGLLIGLLLASWFGSRSTPNAPGKHQLGFTAAERVAAYEEIWRREESALWSWLDERVNQHSLHGAAPSPRLHVAESKTLEKRIQDEAMKERELESAIQVTEEKLKVLKAAVGKKAASASAAAAAHPRTEKKLKGEL